MNSGVIVPIVFAVLFFGWVFGYGAYHRRKHPDKPVRRYFDENSWGPM